ncbi:MAG: UMP kinase [Promethearchaeota archaeon]|nr:MAG: UMP kinase [Candidatus Lokiarchaeota archaeon]
MKIYIMKGIIVIKVGGSLLFTENNEINSKKISELSKIIKNKPDFDKLVIICGGGSIAREYIRAVRLFTGNEALCDIFGIDISRINAKVIISSLKEVAYPQVPKSIEDLSIANLFNKVIIMGGLQPGQSTTSVALEVAEFIGANELIILTDVDGIYNKDPKRFTDAKLLSKLNYEKLQEILINSTNDKQAAAGEYRIFDVVSLQILKRSNIKVIVMSGKDLYEFEKLWNGIKEIRGTVISN